MPPVVLEAEDALRPPVLEDEHQHAVGGRHGEQVEHDRLDGITIERNVTSSRMNAKARTKAKTSGAVLAHVVVEVLRLGVAPTTPASAPATHRPSPARVVAQGRERRLRRRVGAVAVERQSISATVPSSLTRPSIGRDAARVATACAAARRSPPASRGARRRRLDDDDRRSWPRRGRRRSLSYVCMTGRSCGQVVGAGTTVFMPEGRQGQGDQQRRRPSDERDDGAAQDAARIQPQTRTRPAAALQAQSNGTRPC